MTSGPITSDFNGGRLCRVIGGVEMVLLVLLFAGTPLFVVPAAYESFLFPKILWAETLIVAVISLAILQTLLGRPFLLPLNAALAVIAAYAVLHAASIAWAQSPSLALDRSHLWLLLALLAVLLPSSLMRNERRQRVLGASLLASAAITALWALSQDVRQAFFPETLTTMNKLGDWRGFLTAGFGNTSHIGDFLALLYPLGFLVFLSARRRWLSAVMLGWLWICYAALIAVFSVHSNVGLIVAMALTLGALWKCREKTPAAEQVAVLPRILILALGWIGIALFFSFDLPGNPHRPGIFHQALGSDRLAFGWDSRKFIWLTGLEMVREHPWLGVGSGNFTYAFAATHSPLVLADPDLQFHVGSWTNAAHNSLLQSWAEVGVVGPVLLIALFVLAFRTLGRNLCSAPRASRMARMALMAALAAFTIHAQMNFPLQMAASMLMLTFIISFASFLSLNPGAESVSVRMEYGWGTMGLTLHGAMKPVLVSLLLKPQPILATLAFAILCLPAILLQGAQVTAHLRADMAYRSAHDANLRWEAAVMRGASAEEIEMNAAQADLRFKEVFSRWPQHHDARSEYSEFLVRQGRNEEALEQLKRVRERLQSWEIHLRSARAWYQAGQMDNARKYAARALAMKPVEGMLRPQMQAWIYRQIPVEKIPPPPPLAKTEQWAVEK